MKPQNIFSNLLDVLIVLCLLLFFASFGFRDSRTSGWYQQFFPNMNGSTIASLTFLDSLTGYALTSTNSSVQAFILKTTNGGDNWNIIYTYVPTASTVHFTKIQFADSNIGYASTNYYDFYKTTNSGLSWVDFANVPWGADDMALINLDTILLVSSDIIGGGVYRTTNGGLNWSPLGPTGGSGQPNIIYMFNKNIGFTDDNVGANRMKKTTNGGVNWFPIANEAFNDLKLIDTITGWRTNGDVKKTTDGGITWNLQQMPQIFVNYINSISISNINKIWGTGGSIILNNNAYGVIYKSTNSGVNWGYQIADTSIHIGNYDIINFISNNIGWAYLLNSSGVHTTNGGSDTTFYTEINNINNSSVLKNYILYQNYPNPFNPVTTIKYQVLKNANVKLIVYNIAGKEITTLVNEKKYSGIYELEFNGNNVSSGIYFYALFVNGFKVDTKKAFLIK